MKATHRHCYPDGGDVDIGKRVVWFSLTRLCDDNASVYC